MKNHEFIKVCIKNCTCFYFDVIIKFEDFDFDNTLIDEKANENILIYNISHRTLIGPKPWRRRFDQIDGFLRVYDWRRCLALFGSEKYDAIYNRIRYLICQKSGITYVISHKYELKF